MALKKVKGSLDRIFDKSMQDLVRGIRNNKGNEAQFIAQCIDDIKHELKQGNIAIKSNAVLKLVYLQMLGYDISWAAFNIIEVMSAQKFTFKRVGYFASAQSFHNETDVLMLATNLIKKDLQSGNMYDAAVALNGLSCFMTPDLARDLVNDIMSLMSSTKPYIRKRAVLISYKIFLAYPEALRPAFPRLKDKLEDPDQGVQSAAVNVICELARKNPKNYLSLAPLFFKLMTTSTNNWVLIKIIKLFGSLTPLEPRLGKKLIEPLTNLIHSTSAMSLLYECINTVIQGMNEHNASIQLCVQKLRILIEDSDQNLKYLGLLAMSRILKSHPKAVQAHKDLVLHCLDDKDESIRLRALDLLFGMVSKKNLMEIVKKLMIHLQKAEGSQYRDELLIKIIEICSQQNYQYIINFEWYISVLVELTRIDGATHHGSLISSQLLDVAVRVKSIRSFAANQMATLLENSHAIITQLQRNGMSDALYAAAYICGEYCSFIDNIAGVIKAMLRPRTASLTEHIQSIYVQNIMKMYSVAIQRLEEAEAFEEAKELTTTLHQQLQFLVTSGYLEVQERASSASTMLKYLEKAQTKGVRISDEVRMMFHGELNPVAPKAQKKVPIPEGLDLDAWINDPPPESSDEEIEKGFVSTNQTVEEFYTEKKAPQLTPEELNERRERRLNEQANNPNYLMSSAPQTPNGYQNPESPLTGDLPPIVDLDISVPLHVPGLSSSDKYLKQDRERRRQYEMQKSSKRRRGKDKKRKKGRKGRLEESEDDEYEQHLPTHTIDIVQEEMPEGAIATDSDEEKKSSNPYNALDIDLDAPLTKEDALPVPTHRISSPPTKQPTSEEKEKTEKKKSKKKRDKKKVKNLADKIPKTFTALLINVKDKKSRSICKQENLLVQEEEDDKLVEKPLVGMSNGDANIQSQPGPEPEKKTEPAGLDDYSFWLSTDQPTQNPLEKETSAIQESVEVEPKKKSSEKSKKSKKHKHKNKKEKEVPQVEDRPSTPPITDLSRYVTLGENEDISVEYESRCNTAHARQFVVSCVVSNKINKTIKNIDFNVLDTLNTKLIRGSGSSYDPVRIPFALLPMSRNEAQLELTAVSVVMPQKLRGTITYIVKDDSSSSQNKLDFQLYIPCSSYLVAQNSTSDAFTQLLASGTLTEKSSIKIQSSETVKLAHVIQRICFMLKFTLIERVENSASLYSTSIQGHPVCLLVKQNPTFIAVDGKCSDANLLRNILDEVKPLIN